MRKSMRCVGKVSALHRPTQRHGYNKEGCSVDNVGTPLAFLFFLSVGTGQYFNGFVLT